MYRRGEVGHTNKMYQKGEVVHIEISVLERRSSSYLPNVSGSRSNSGLS